MVDKDAATELSLYIDNDSYMYNRQKSFINNIKAKIKSGRYDASKAPKLWIYYVDEGAKRYVKEFASGNVSSLFNKATREYLASQYAKEAYDQIMRGEL